MDIRKHDIKAETANPTGGFPPVGRGGILSRSDGATIAYSILAGKKPTVVFLHGYYSDRNGGKAVALEAACRERGQAFLRFDSFGHGESSGEIADGTIGRWVEDTVAVIEALAPGPVVLVGSSLGGWIAALAARILGARVVGLVGIAAAPDFTEDLLWASLSSERRHALIDHGEIVLEHGDPPWRIRRALIEEGRAHLLLRGPIAIDCPVRLIHGQRDADVPWATALRLADGLTSRAVEVILVKDGDHRLSRPEDLARMCRQVDDLCRLAAK